MYDPEKALIAKVLETQDLRTVVHHKIGDGHIVDDDVREQLGWMKGFFEDYGKVPSLTLLQEQFPDYEPEDADDDLGAIIAVIKEKKLYADLQTVVKQIAAESRESAQEGLTVLKRAAADLSVEFSEGKSEDMTKMGREVRRHYNRLKKSKGLLGYPWPWKALNTWTRGIRRGTFNLFYGPEGTFKTFYLLVIGNHVHQTRGIRPLIISPEMTTEEIRYRWAAIRTRINYDRFQDGALLPKEERRFFRELKELEKDPPFWVHEIDADDSKEALIEIAAKAEETDAQLVLCDSISMIIDDEDWKPFMSFCKGLKKVAKKTRVPYVAAHHTNRAGRGAGKDASDSKDMALGMVGRILDVNVRLVRTPQNRENEEVMAILRKAREGKDAQKVMLHAKPAKDFSQKYVFAEQSELEGDGGEDGIV